MSDLREQSSSKLEDESIDTIMSEKQKKMNRKVIINRALRDYLLLIPTLHSMRIPEGEGKEKGQKNM